MRDPNIEVHQSHCCDTHGCKYGDDDCPVTNGQVTQDHPCEWCCEDWDDWYEEGISRVTVRPDTKRAVQRVMRMTNTRDPETVINGAVIFLTGEIQRCQRELRYTKQ
jgi:hypothetical protein